MQIAVLYVNRSDGVGPVTTFVTKFDTLPSFIDWIRSTSTITVLDIATGSAEDIISALYRWTEWRSKISEKKDGEDEQQKDVSRSDKGDGRDVHRDRVGSGRGKNTQERTWNKGNKKR